jgi:hypothetical protein
MPNWCENDVSIGGNKTDMEKFLAAYCEEDQNCRGQYRLLYNKISPMGEYEADETGFATIEAQRDAWGCKWEMSDYALCLSPNNWDGKECMYLDGSFDTAWGPPYKIYDKIVELIEENEWNIEIDEWFYKEPGMQIAGWLPE